MHAERRDAGGDLGSGLAELGRERLEKRLKDICSQQLASTRTYLEELACLRSRLRSVDETKACFGPTDRYYWDALEHMPQEHRDLVALVLMEKLKCFWTQSEAATLTEMQAVLKKANQRSTELEAANCALQVELDDRRRSVTELERRLGLHLARVRNLEKEALELSVVRQRLTEAQERVEELQQQIEILSAVMQRAGVEDPTELANQLGKELDERRRLEHELQDAWQLIADMRHRDKVYQETALMRESLTCRLAHLPIHAIDPDDIASALLSASSDLAEAYDQAVSGWFRAAAEALVRRCKDHEKQYEKESLHRILAERRADDSLAQSAALQEEVSRLNKSHKTMEERLHEVTATTEAHAYEKLFAENQQLQAAHAQHQEALEAARDANISLNEEAQRARLNLCEQEGVVAELEAKCEAVSAALNHAEESQCHPSRVGALRAEVRQLRHEHVALTSANSRLRSALSVLRQRLLELEQDSKLGVERQREAARSADEARFVLDTCSRTVFNRLYEDAVRRHAQFKRLLETLEEVERQRLLEAFDCEDSWLDPMGLPLRVQSYSPPPLNLCNDGPSSLPDEDTRDREESGGCLRRSLSDPGSISDSTLSLRAMLVQNAQDLALRLHAPLFNKPVHMATALSRRVSQQRRPQSAGGCAQRIGNPSRRLSSPRCEAQHDQDRPSSAPTTIVGDIAWHPTPVTPGPASPEVHSADPTCCTADSARVLKPSVVQLQELPSPPLRDGRDSLAALAGAGGPRVAQGNSLPMYRTARTSGALMLPSKVAVGRHVASTAPDLTTIVPDPDGFASGVSGGGATHAGDDAGVSVAGDDGACNADCPNAPVGASVVSSRIAHCSSIACADTKPPVAAAVLPAVRPRSAVKRPKASTANTHTVASARRRGSEPGQRQGAPHTASKMAAISSSNPDRASQALVSTGADESSVPNQAAHSADDVSAAVKMAVRCPVSSPPPVDGRRRPRSALVATSAARRALRA